MSAADTRRYSLFPDRERRTAGILFVRRPWKFSSRVENCRIKITEIFRVSFEFLLVDELVSVRMARVPKVVVFPQLRRMPARGHRIVLVSLHFAMARIFSLYLAKPAGARMALAKSCTT
jgi:hypothetical protein